MKIRQGFVSNSSSSSFIIGVQPGSRLTSKKLIEIFAVPKTSPLFGVATQLAEFIADHAARINQDDLLSDWGYGTLQDAADNDVMEAKLLCEGLCVYRLDASDDSCDPIETYLCNTALDIDTPEITIHGGGGY
jgi:hypothetical protein